jgi:hypothetical protein
MWAVALRHKLQDLFQHEGHIIVLNGIVMNKRSTKLRNNAKSSSKTCHLVHKIM